MRDPRSPRSSASPGPGRILSVAVLGTAALLGAAFSCTLQLRAKHDCNVDSDCLEGACVEGVCDPCTRIDDAEGCVQLGSCAWVNVGRRTLCLTVPPAEEQPDCENLEEAACRQQYPTCVFNGESCETFKPADDFCSPLVFEYECSLEEGCAWTGESCYYLGDSPPDLCSSEAFDEQACLGLGAGCRWSPEGYCSYEPGDLDQCGGQVDRTGCDQVGGCRWVGEPVSSGPDGGNGGGGGDDGGPVSDGAAADAAAGAPATDAAPNDAIGDAGDARPDLPPPADGGGGTDPGPDGPRLAGYCTSADAAPQGSCDLHRESGPCIAGGCAWANVAGQTRCVYVTQQERCANQAGEAGCTALDGCAWDGQACFYYSGAASMSGVVP